MTPPQIPALADAMTDLATLALAFSRIERTACYHPDGRRRETDSDHTVMLGWIAPALADVLYPAYLDPDLVAAFANLHDAPEVFCGDTPTLRITAAGRAAKAQRERDATAEWRRRFATRFPWLTDRLERYERQEEPEARFVRAVDKQLPKIVHMLGRATGLREMGFTTAELADFFTAQQADIAQYAGEFTELMELGAELAQHVLARLAEAELAESLP